MTPRRIYADWLSGFEKRGRTPSSTLVRMRGSERMRSTVRLMGCTAPVAIDKATMRGFDESCLATPLPIAPKRIKTIREQAHVSQPVFVRYLNTSESTVQKWEAGTKRLSGMALKLLAVVKKHSLKVLA
jgi:putative transcriptional regulator